ncbi:MAG: sarcosine oxidase subunit beta family protein [Candidatus Limnocylindrales bacterium]
MPAVTARLPQHPARLWRHPEPRAPYDVVIIGGGGHGLAAAYYLARNHGITNVAVVERGWLAGGNMARNTAIIRSNYLWDESAAIYEHALKLWEGLAEELDYDLLLSQRGVLNLAHNLGDVREGQRRVSANRLNGVDAEWLTTEDVKRLVPIVDTSPDVRYPVLGATYQPRGGIAKHDHVAWAYARAADALGVDLIEGAEVTAIDIDGGRVTGVQTSRGPIRAGKVAIVAAGHASIVAALAGLRLPLQSHPLQALVSELLEPVHPTVVMSNAVHVYVSQAHKGELVMGAGIDSYNGYAQRGAFHIIEHQMAAALELFPIFARAHVIRTWGGIVDVSPDASPIISKTPVDGLYLDCGWGTGGFKATPASGWVLAHTVANDEAAPAEPAVRTGALRDRRPDRRARRGGGRPLMLLIPCPHCGPRDETEFKYGGQAGIAYPADPDALTDAEWLDYLFLRDNPKGPWRERWVHTAGCRRWFDVTRDTLTNEFGDIGR